MLKSSEKSGEAKLRPMRGSPGASSGSVADGMGPGVAVSVGVGEEVLIGVELGGEVGLEGRVGAAVRVAATIVETRSGGGSPARRLQPARVSPTVSVKQTDRMVLMGYTGCARRRSRQKLP